MDKVEYIAKTLSRTKRKDYENYVVNAIWNRIKRQYRDALWPQSQRYVRGEDGGWFLIDLYFPQLNLGIEVDEAHHLSQVEFDRHREEIISDILTKKMPGRYETLRIPIFEKAGGRAVRRLTLAEVDGEIDGAVRAIEAKIEKFGDGFEPWDPDSGGSEALRGRAAVKAGDAVGFDTIAEACNALFGTCYKGMQRSYFAPPTLKGTAYEGCKVWFPKLAVDGRAVADGWNNTISEDGERIYEYNEEREVGAGDGGKRVVVPRVYDYATCRPRYMLAGVYEWKGALVDGGVSKQLYERVSDEFEIIARAN